MTEHVGLVATCATTYNEPYNVARVLASIDHLSGGRAGWNLVTGGVREDAFNFNLSTAMSRMPTAMSGPRNSSMSASAFGTVSRTTRSSATRRPDAIHSGEAPRTSNHKGKHFSVKGPLSVARSPQGRPVIIQAGRVRAREELIRADRRRGVRVPILARGAKAFYADVKGRLAKFGRSPDELKVMPGVALFIGRTAAEAEEKYEELQSLLHSGGGAVAVARADRRYRSLGLSARRSVPRPPGQHGADEHAGRAGRLARRENLTLRQTAMRMAAARSHWMLKGTAQHIADQLEEWFVNEAADGFNLLPQIMPGSLNEFVDLVIPELQRRGLFRTEYEGRTLRENLGVPRPANRYVAAGARRPCAAPSAAPELRSAIQSAISGRTLYGMLSQT